MLFRRLGRFKAGNTPKLKNKLKIVQFGNQYVFKPIPNNPLPSEELSVPTSRNINASMLHHESLNYQGYNKMDYAAHSAEIISKLIQELPNLKQRSTTQCFNFRLYKLLSRQNSELSILHTLQSR